MACGMPSHLFDAPGDAQGFTRSWAGMMAHSDSSQIASKKENVEAEAPTS